MKDLNQNHLLQSIKRKRTAIRLQHNIKMHNIKVPILEIGKEIVLIRSQI